MSEQNEKQELQLGQFFLDEKESGVINPLLMETGNKGPREAKYAVMVVNLDTLTNSPTGTALARGQMEEWKGALCVLINQKRAAQAGKILTGSGKPVLKVH